MLSGSGHGDIKNSITFFNLECLSQKLDSPLLIILSCRYPCVNHILSDAENICRSVETIWTIRRDCFNSIEKLHALFFSAVRSSEMFVNTAQAAVRI